MSKEKQYNDGEIKEFVQKGRIVVVLFDAVYDLTAFAPGHPGGHDILKENAGTDATQKFIETGHLTSGRIIEALTKYRIGRYLVQAKL